MQISSLISPIFIWGNYIKIENYAFMRQEFNQKTIEKIKNDFEDKDFDAVEQILGNISLSKRMSDEEITIDELRLAILKMANGNLREVLNFSKLAKRGYRDIIKWSNKLNVQKTEIEKLWLEKDKSIEWVAFDAQNCDAKYIDNLLNPFTDFIKQLETQCVAECCGIQAFAFYEEDIARAMKMEPVDGLLDKWNALVSAIEGMNDEVVASSQMNQLISRETFCVLLRHIENAIKKNIQE